VRGKHGKAAWLRPVGMVSKVREYGTNGAYRQHGNQCKYDSCNMLRGQSPWDLQPRLLEHLDVFEIVYLCGGRRTQLQLKLEGT
jgi:hypothetical protein